MPGTEYVWQDPDRPITIHLDLAVVSRLSLEAMEAYKAVPRRGLEIGGLLTGSIEGSVVHIHDFHAVESEHQWGPSYRLSESDHQAFEEAMRQHPDAVAIFRTSTREQSSSLEEDDVALFRHYFSHPENLFLLIRPAATEATVFLADQDTLVPVHHFPFRAGELAPFASQPEPEPGATVPLMVEIPGTAPVAEPAPVPLLRRYVWPTRIAAVLFGVVVGAALYHGFHHRTPAPTRAVAGASAPVAAPPVAPSVPANLDLRVEWDGPSLLLRWDPNSPQIREARKAVLYVEDHNHESQLDLDRAELDGGVVRYWPRSQDVTFRLKISTSDEMSHETIHVAGNESPPKEVAPPPPVRQPEPNPPPEPAASTAQSKGSAARVLSAPVPATPPPVEPHPSPFTPAAKPAPVTKTLADSAPPPDTTTPPPNIPPPAAAPPAPARSPEPQVHVSVEPVSNSRMGNVIGHIPLLRRLRKGSQAYVPPAPVHQVQPVLSAREKRALVGPVPVDIRILVGESGKVHDAELLHDGWRHPDLANLAISAARRWEFTPARMGSEKVEAEVILHFKFLPEEPPPPSR